MKVHVVGDILKKLNEQTEFCIDGVKMSFHTITSEIRAKLASLHCEEDTYVNTESGEKIQHFVVQGVGSIGFKHVSFTRVIRDGMKKI